MPSWIAAWIGLFAFGVFVAIVADKENRRDNGPIAAVMLVTVGVVIYIMVAK